VGAQFRVMPYSISPDVQPMKVPIRKFAQRHRRKSAQRGCSHWESLVQYVCTSFAMAVRNCLERPTKTLKESRRMKSQKYTRRGESSGRQTNAVRRERIPARRVISLCSPVRSLLLLSIRFSHRQKERK
jgi:hypothetical protein